MLVVILLGAIIVRVITVFEHSDVRTPARLRTVGWSYPGYWCQRPERIAALRQLAGRQRAAAMQGREERYLIVAFTVITDVPEAVGP